MGNNRVDLTIDDIQHVDRTERVLYKELQKSKQHKVQIGSDQDFV